MQEIKSFQFSSNHAPGPVRLALSWQYVLAVKKDSNLIVFFLLPPAVPRRADGRDNISQGKLLQNSNPFSEADG